MNCKVHPRYRGKNAPRSKCKDCWLIYELRHQAETNRQPSRETWRRADNTVEADHPITLAEVITSLEVDMSVWQIDWWFANWYQMGRSDKKKKLDYEKGAATGHTEDSGLWRKVTNYQIKVKFKPREFKLDVEALLKDLGKRSPKRRKATVLDKDVLMQVSIVDTHMGLFVADGESITPYNLDIAEKLYTDALESLLASAAPWKPKQFLYIVGNDALHADSLKYDTTAGTHLFDAAHLFNAYQRMADLYIHTVRRLRQLGNVKIIVVHGNHDRLLSFTLGQLLHYAFLNDKGVEVDRGAAMRKYHQHGRVLLGFEHGRLKPARMAGLMANEARADWAGADYGEFYCGDQHRKGGTDKAFFEELGVSVEFLPALVSPNDWSNRKSFSWQKRGATAFIHSAKNGTVARLQHNLFYKEK